MMLALLQRLVAAGGLLLVGCSMLCQSAAAESIMRIEPRRAFSISPEGRYLLFDGYLYDRKEGNHVPISGGPFAVTPGARFVSFTSSLENLVAGDTNGRPDAFLLDRQTGVTSLISVNSAEAQARDGDSGGGPIGADGRFVMFDSYASDLEPGDPTGTPDLFVRDRQQGTTERVIVAADGGFPHYPIGAQINSTGYGISGDGRFATFDSAATNLVPTGNGNGRRGVFVRDLLLNTTERVSVGLPPQKTRAFAPSISRDGRFVAFSAVDTEPGKGTDVFVRDRLLGVTERINVNPQGGASNEGAAPFESVSMSGDGRFVAFASNATDIVPGGPDTEHLSIFIRDRLTRTTEKVAVEIEGEPRDNLYPRLSANGRFLGFVVVENEDEDYLEATYLRDRGLLPDGRNDLAVDFGANGLWLRLNNSTWTKIATASPDVVAAGDLDGNLQDDVIAGFRGRGLLARYNKAGPWRKLHAAVPARIVSGDFDGNGTDDLAADFGSQGIWVRLNDAAWTKVHVQSGELRIGDLNGDGADELIASFPNAGIWARYGNRWVQVIRSSWKRLVTGDFDGEGQDDLLGGCCGQHLHVVYSKSQRSKSYGDVPTDGLATGDLDGNDQDEALVVTNHPFVGGLRVSYNDAQRPWVKIDDRPPTILLTADLDRSGKDDVVAAFGSEGVFARYNDAGTFKLLRAWPAQAIAAGGFD